MNQELIEYLHSKMKTKPIAHPEFESKEEIDEWVEEQKRKEEDTRRLRKNNSGSRRHCNEFFRTDTGRLAGDGMIHDDYGEESFSGDSPYQERAYTPIPIKGRKAEEKPVKTYRLSEEELEKYRRMKEVVDS